MRAWTYIPSQLIFNSCENILYGIYYLFTRFYLRFGGVCSVTILVRFDHDDYSGDCQFTQLSDSSFAWFVAYFD